MKKKKEENSSRNLQIVDRCNYRLLQCRRVNLHFDEITSRRNNLAFVDIMALVKPDRVLLL